MRSSLVGIDEAEHRQHLQAIARVEPPRAGQRRAVDRVEEIDRDRFDRQIAQREGHLDHVGVGFAHADDAAGAQLHAGGADGLQRGDAIGIGVRRCRSRRRSRSLVLRL